MFGWFKKKRPQLIFIVRKIEEDVSSTLSRPRSSWDVIFVRKKVQMVFLKNITNFSTISSMILEGIRILEKQGDMVKHDVVVHDATGSYKKWIDRKAKLANDIPHHYAIGG